MGGREKLLSFPAPGSTKSNESLVIGQRASFLILPQQPGSAHMSRGDILSL